MTCDLHTHSVYSDGTWTPQQIVEKAKEQGLIVALTDHNSVSGLPEFLEAAEKLGVEGVPGVEFSTDYRGTEVHIVALFVCPESYDAIREYVAPGDRAKEQSNWDLIDRLQKAGYPVDYEEILAKTPDGRVNRANIASELVAKGCFSTEKEAFETVLQEKHGFYVPAMRPDAVDTIAFIRALGALPVLAHPYLSFKKKPELLDAFLPEACSRGLVAMETRYATYSEEITEKARAVAKSYGLLESGGSDFHGSVKPNNPLGMPVIPLEIYEQLKMWK